MLSDYRYSKGVQPDFFSVFAMYFSSVIGVHAGTTFYENLKDPASAIPKGTLIAVALSTTSYLLMTTLIGMAAVRDASGNLTIFLSYDHIDGNSCKPDCLYGLHNNNEMMNMMALWEPLFYGGCWAATLSTALMNMMSILKLIQALGWDRIFLGITFFSKYFGKHGETYISYVVVFTVSFQFLIIIGNTCLVLLGYRTPKGNTEPL